MDRNTTSYLYAADGRKLRATYKTFPGQNVGDDDRYTERNDSGLVRPGNGRIFVPSTVVETKTVDYVGNLIYEDNVIKKILIDGGYITFNEGNAPEYHFYIKDHLGNNRVVVHTSGEVEQVNHYYPYGGLMAESTNWNTQWYKYNGKARASESRESTCALLCRVQPRLDTVKELDRMHGLDWYDYGARWQDAAIGGRWHAMDPLCEKYYDVSPYVYCHNNPVNLFDVDGRDDLFDENGFIIDSTPQGDAVKIMNDGVYKDITEVNFSNNSSAIANIGRFYLSISDKSEFNIEVGSTGDNVPVDAVFSNTPGTGDYQLYMTNGHVNKTLGNRKDFECVTFHESTHRYDASTLGGTLGEVNAIIRTANECPVWDQASSDYVASQASYAVNSLIKSGVNPNVHIDRLNNAFAGRAMFGILNNEITWFNVLEEVICPSSKQ